MFAVVRSEGRGVAAAVAGSEDKSGTGDGISGQWHHQVEEDPGADIPGCRGMLCVHGCGTPLQQVLLYSPFIYTYHHTTTP